MSKILITGDIHGQYKPIKEIITKANLNDKDIIILLGDAGFNFFFNYRDKKFKEKINSYGMIIFTIRGNHEERPSVCAAAASEKWHTEDFWGNKVYVENNYPNIKYALDVPAKYEIPTAQGIPIKTLVLPGAYSVDKYYRIANGWSWFEQEQLSKEEMAVGTNFALFNSWDMVLSHTCPISYEPTDLFLRTVDQSTVDKTMERWLGGLEYQMSYKLWCWGHYHSNRIYPHYNNSDRLMLFNDCYCDVYKYFCGNYNIIDCLIKVNEDTKITNINGLFC